MYKEAIEKNQLLSWYWYPLLNPCNMLTETIRYISTEILLLLCYYIGVLLCSWQKAQNKIFVPPIISWNLKTGERRKEGRGVCHVKIVENPGSKLILWRSFLYYTFFVLIGLIFRWWVKDHNLCCPGFIVSSKVTHEFDVQSGIAW